MGKHSTYIKGGLNPVKSAVHLTALSKQHPKQPLSISSKWPSTSFQVNYLNLNLIALPYLWHVLLLCNISYDVCCCHSRLWHSGGFGPYWNRHDNDRWRRCRPWFRLRHDDQADQLWRLRAVSLGHLAAAAERLFYMRLFRAERQIFHDYSRMQGFCTQFHCLWCTYEQQL